MRSVSHNALAAMQTLWLARHANRQDFVDPDWPETAERPHDPGLSPDGVEQAKQLGHQVSSIDVDRILASPFLRTVQTAHHVATVTEQEVLLEPGLGEWLNPDWFAAPPQTLAPSTLAERFPTVRLDHEACLHPTYPEAKEKALERLGTTARCLCTRYPEQTLLLVGHGITVQGILHGLVGSDVADPGCPLASLTRVEYQNDSWRIHCRNETGHLTEGADASDRLI